MKQLIPHFYPNFACIASRCSDSCCIGWEIDIDPDTADYYRSCITDGDPFSSQLSQKICWEFPAHFLLKEDDRCPFLNQDNLCEIYIHLGEQALCEICDQHPRFHEWFGDYKESGLGLCCEEAVRLLLESGELSFLSRTIDEPADDQPFDSELLSAMLSVRQQMFSLLKNTNLAFAARLQILLRYADAIQQALDFADFPALTALSQEIPAQLFSSSCDFTDSPQLLLSDLLEFLASLEPIDPRWTKRLRKLAQKLPQLLPLSEQLPFQNLCSYTLYRYLLKSVWDSDCLSRTKFAVLFTLLCRLLWLALPGESTSDLPIEPPPDSRINCLKAISKELEYSEENLQTLLDLSWEHEEQGGFLSVNSLSCLSCFLF